jgi:hypothetical protein
MCTKANEMNTCQRGHNNDIQNNQSIWMVSMPIMTGLDLHPTSSSMQIGIKNITRNALGHSRFEDFILNLFD